MITYLTGVNFRTPAEKDVVKSLEIGDELRLEREPTNQWDSNAIRVYHESTFIGFIPREDNEDLARSMDDSIIFTCKVDSRSGPLKVGLEVLPA